MSAMTIRAGCGPGQLQGETRHRHAPRTCTGFSLTELMIALVIGISLLGALLQAYANGTAAYRAVEVTAELEDRLNFALRALEEDLLQAGFWGLTLDPATITGERPLIQCSGNDIRDWALTLTLPVAARSGAPEHPCPAYSAPLAGSDGLTVRHASGQPAAPENRLIQLLTMTHAAEMFSDGIAPAATAPADVHTVQISSWYVDRRSSEPDMPSLRRYALVSNGLLENQEVMPGIREFTLEFLVDSNADGIPDAFVAADATAGNVHAVRIRLQAISRARDADGRQRSARAERLIALRNQPPT